MVYFNNSNNNIIQNKIISRIREAKTSLRIAVSWFNNQSLFEVVMEKLTSGCKVELIILNDKINNSGVNFQKFINNKGIFYFSNVTPGKGIMHHKFCIIDENLVISGSYNWTNKAEYYNMENITIFHEKNIVKRFNDEFNEITANYKPIQDISASKEMVLYSEDNLSLLEGIVYENGIQQSSISSDEILISIIDKLTLNECRSSWNEFYKNPCEIIINSWENAPPIFAAGADIPRGGSTRTVNFYTLVDNLTQIKIYAIKNQILSTKRRICIFRNLECKPIGTNILEIKLLLDNSGNLKVECKEIGNKESLGETIKEIFSSSRLQFMQK